MTSEQPQIEPDYYPFGPPQAPSTHTPVPAPAILHNTARMGVVTLGPDGEFIRSRYLSPTELFGAWVEHFVRRMPGGAS